MKRLTRRRFAAFASTGVAGAVLTACGGDKSTSTDLTPTRIPDSEVAGIPTLADMATPPDLSTDAGAGGGEALTTVELSTVDLKFEPATFTIAADTDVTVNLTNKGALPHDFAMDDPAFTSDVINGGGSTTFTLNLPAGTYDFYCSEPGHKEAGMVGTITVGGDAAAAPAGGATAPTSATVTAVDLKFEPAAFTIAADTDVAITFTNNGALQHDFHVEAPTAFTSELLNGGGTEDFTLNLPAGEYDFWCTVPGHKEAGMVGKLTVAEAGAAPAAPAGGSPAAGAPEAPAGGSAAATSVDLATVDMKFEPAEFTIAANTDVTVNLKNNGALPHDFAMDDPAFTSDLLNGGGSTTFTLNLPAGSYEFYCSEPGHKQAGMVGTVTVQ